MSPQPLRRLLDIPAIAELETKALMKPRYADVDARDNFPEIDEASKATFGLTYDEAEGVARPDGWDDIDAKAERVQVEAFEAEGWDVTDAKRRPLRMLHHFAPQLWLAIRGVAGALPFVADTSEDDLAASLAREAARFRRDR
jgi:hypothetical protein